MLDYKLKTTEERIECVNKILDNTPEDKLTPKYLNAMSDYILFTADKETTKKEKKQEHPIITKNRNATLTKRQVSYEEIVSNLENGEDGIYSLMLEPDKNRLLDNKETLTDDDFETIPELVGYLNIIESLKSQLSKAEGQRKFALKKQIIETWQQMYMLKTSYKGMPSRGHMNNQVRQIAHMRFDEHIIFDENDMPQSDCMVSMFNPDHVSFMLTYYSQLKQESYEELEGDMHWMLIDLENTAERALANEPILYSLLVWKIDGLSNDEIQEKMYTEYGITHSSQYFSSIWRNRIPKMIAEQAQKDYVIWYYTNIEYGSWKKCGKCGKTKLAHPLFFSRNNSRDSFYSICKECRRTH